MSYRLSSAKLSQFLIPVSLVTAAIVGCSVKEVQNSTPDVHDIVDASSTDAHRDSIPEADAGNDAAAADASDDAAEAAAPILDCTTAAGRSARWASMDNETLEPPYLYAGIDMSANGGITLEDAEKIDCPGTIGADNGDGTTTASWGDNNEVQFNYLNTTHVVVGMSMTAGYAGTVVATSKDAAHTYELGVGKITKDSQAFLIHWQDNAQGPKDLTELYNAVVNTYAPTLPQSDDCTQDSKCLYLPDAGDGTGIFGFRPVNLYFVCPSPLTLPADQASKPTELYNFFKKST